MSAAAEHRAVLADAAEKLFAGVAFETLHRANDDSALQVARAKVWQQIEDSGMPSVLVPESAGGFGGGWEDALVLLHAAAFHAVPLPVADTIVALRLLSEAGICAPAGPLALVVGSDLRFHGRRLTGEAACVPWGGTAAYVVVVARSGDERQIVLVDAARVHKSTPTHNVAAEPLTDLRFDGAAAESSGEVVSDAFDLGALARAASIGGALSCALQLSVQHANERRQFGKPIGKFQAIQQALAVLAAETAAVNCAAIAACQAADRGTASFEIAAAKLRANRAVGIATSIAHQVHGAIGFTREHRLHLATQRLWSWRCQYGNDRYWASRLGGIVARHGAAGLWPFLTARSDP